MSWKDKVKEWGGGLVSFLSEDGECITFVVAGEPTLIHSTFKERKTERIGAPIITDDGFSLLIMGKRLACKLSKYEDKFTDNAFIVVRHGEKGDITTTYDIHTLEDGEKTAALFNKLNTDFELTMIDDAVREAVDIMGS